jgi:NPCBM/NEW2 domain
MRGVMSKLLLRRINWLALLAAGVWLLIQLNHAVAAESSSIAVPVDGEPFTANLKSIDADWNLDFATADGPRRIPAAKLVQWGYWRERGDGAQVLLANGGLVVAAEVVALDRDQIQFDSDLFDTARLPRTALAGIVFHQPTDRARGEKLADRIVADAADTDRVLLANGDELTGTITGFAKNALEFQTTAGPLKIDIGRIDAVIFHSKTRSSTKPRGLHAWIGFRDGSRLLASSIVVADKRAKLVLPGGAELTAPIDAISAIMPLGGQVMYLSDLSAAGYRFIPYLDLAWNYLADRSVEGNPLRADNHRYLKGLGMHSASRLTYDLDQPYRRFDANLAVDDETAGRGSVIGRVFVDPGDGKWELRFESPVVRGGRPSLPVSVDLKGAKRISLLVDFADRGDQQDHADWLGARLVK